MATPSSTRASRHLSGTAWFLIIVGGALLTLGLVTSISPLTLFGLVCLVGAAVEVFVRFHGGWETAKRVSLWLLGSLGALLLLGSVGAWIYFRPPGPDAFYTPPDEVPAEPGQLIRSEPFTRDVPDGAQAWRILYTTTNQEGSPTVASGLVLASRDMPDGPRPVIMWTHGTTGSDPACAPSLLADPYPFDPTIPALDQVLANDWIFVATDYAGLGTEGPHPYLIGEGEARSALDSVRAARQLAAVELEDRTVVWGHSQGGHAALWTGILEPSYAPEVNVIGVAALAPAANLPALLEGVQDTEAGKILTAVFLRAYTETYPDVSFDELVRPTNRWLTRDIATRCLAAPGALASLIEVTWLMDGPIWAMSPTSNEALAARLRENIPTRPINVPLLIAQGLADEVALPDVQEVFVNQRCDSGQSLEFWTYSGLDHLGVVGPESPLNEDIIEWTMARLAGEPQAAGCTTVER